MLTKEEFETQMKQSSKIANKIFKKIIGELNGNELGPIGMAISMVVNSVCQVVDDDKKEQKIYLDELIKLIYTQFENESVDMIELQ